MGAALLFWVREATVFTTWDSPGNSPYQVPRLLSRTAGKLAEGGKRDSPIPSQAGHHPAAGDMAGQLSVAP